ncbi:MAG: hypothetical protein Fues2KO_53120 [Fuerstiella sp.]
MTVNLNGQAFPTNGITFNGAAGLNRLSVNGSDTETAVMTLDATTFGSGSIDFGTAAVQFTGMESIDTADFADFTTRLTGHDENLTANKGLDYLSGLVQVVRLSGSSGGANVPNTSYAGHGSVALDTTTDDGDDTIAVHALDNAHGIGGFALNTGLGNDSVQLLGNVVTQGDFVLTDPLAIAADGAVTSVGGDVQLSGAIDLGANTLTLNAAGSNSQLAGIVSGTGGSEPDRKRNNQPADCQHLHRNSHRLGGNHSTSRCECTGTKRLGHRRCHRCRRRTGAGRQRDHQSTANPCRNSVGGGWRTGCLGRSGHRVRH